MTKGMKEIIKIRWREREKIMPNWNKLAKSYEKNALVALQQFIRIPSVYDAKTAKEGAPFGADVKKALEYTDINHQI